MEKMISCYFHTILGIKKLIKSLKFNSTVGKNDCYKISQYIKNTFFCYFHIFTFGL